MTRLSIATLITTVVLLTGCDAADMAYNIFTTEEYELLCQTESGEGIRKTTKNGRTEVEQIDLTDVFDPESTKFQLTKNNPDPDRIIIRHPAHSDSVRFIDSNGTTNEGTFYPTINGVRLTFDLLANNDIEIPENTEVKASRIYDINFDLTFSMGISFFASDPTETMQLKLTTKGNCKHLDWETP